MWRCRWLWRFLFGFNPRFAPESEAICGPRRHPCDRGVSIRASLRRAKRSGRRSGTSITSSFNPRFAPESEAIVLTLFWESGFCGFNPRFAPESEAISARAPFHRGKAVSIRASLRRAKRSPVGPEHRHERFVSIRASLRRAKRCKPNIADQPTARFQSALRSGERSDRRLLLRAARAHRFNPRFAPESEAIAQLRDWPNREKVSIRASLRRAKRSSVGSHEKPFVSFNPRFAPESEAMERDRNQPWESTCFNPRFAPESEAISPWTGCMNLSPVSIRASLRRAKRWERLVSNPTATCFNPRFAPESEAMPASHVIHSMAHAFQSALRSGERSDFIEFVSPDEACVSIRASLRRAKRYVFAGSISYGRVGFNPRFAPESEAISTHVVLGGDALFQSALRSGERSDSGRVMATQRMFEFQSALRSGERSDGSVPKTAERPTSFNPRFAPESEAI